MRLLLPTLLFASLAVAPTSRAEDLRARTADGREVVLKDDGTWSFVDSPKPEIDQDLPIAYEGKRKGFAVRLKPGSWVKAEKPVNPIAEVMFTHADGEVYATIIAERISVPLETIKEASLANMKAADPEAKIVHEEMRKVDGSDVLCVTAEVTTQGIPLTFHNYYYSGPGGSIQVLTWTGRNLFDEVKPEMDKFLNGLVILKK